MVNMITDALTCDNYLNKTPKLKIVFTIVLGIAERYRISNSWHGGVLDVCIFESYERAGKLSGA